MLYVFEIKVYSKKNVDPFCCVGKHTRMVGHVPCSSALPTVSYRRVLRLDAGDHTTENKLFLNTFRCWISCSSNARARRHLVCK